MVAPSLLAQWTAYAILADQPARSILERLDPRQRGFVVIAIFVIVLLGLTLIACVMIGGRWVRRLARQKPHEFHASTNVSGANESRRFLEPLRGEISNAPSDATVLIDQASSDTKTDRPKGPKGDQQ